MCDNGCKGGGGCNGGCGCGKKSGKPTCRKSGPVTLFANTPKRICHNLGSDCVVLQAYDTSTNQQVLLDWSPITGNSDCVEVTSTCDISVCFTMQK